MTIAPTRWTLYVADQLGARIAQIDTFNAFTLIGRHNAVSTWELELPRQSVAADAIIDTQHPRIVVQADEVTYRSGPVTHLERAQTGTEDQLLVNGVDDDAWLARRVAHPSPAQAAPPYSAAAYDVRAGNAAQVLAQYVNVNAGPLAVPARRVPGLVVPTPAPAGPAVSLSARYENLLDFVMNAANSVGLGVRVVDLTLAVFVPQLRAVVFSVELGTLAETSAVTEAPSANWVYVAGQGEGTARKIVEVSDATSITGWGRAETFQDRRDTNDTALLTFAGNETLARSVIPPTVTFVPLQTEAQQFPRDWNLGDLVTLRVGTMVRVDLVREVTLTLEEGEAVTVEARLGSTGDLRVLRSALEQNRRIRQLERV